MPGRPISLRKPPPESVLDSSLKAFTGVIEDIQSMLTLMESLSGQLLRFRELLEIAMQVIGDSRPPCDESTSEAPSSTGGRVRTVPPPPP